jgi:hypothetical protein
MSTSARFNSGLGAINEGTDNTDRIRSNQFLAPAYATTIAIVPFAAYTLVQPATLTGVATVTIGVGSATTAPYVGDVITFLLVPDGTTRVVTFGTGTLPNGTLSVTTAKTASISFMFNGTAWQETGRTVTA